MAGLRFLASARIHHSYPREQLRSPRTRSCVASVPSVLCVSPPTSTLIIWSDAPAPGRKSASNTCCCSAGG